MEAMTEGDGRSEMENTIVETSAESFDSSTVFHTVNDILGFVLYMHQQIPSTLQDISSEFDDLQAEYTDLEKALKETELKASLRRKHSSKMRDVRLGVRRLEKLMKSVVNLRTALRQIINEIPNIEGIILALGASVMRPVYCYELCFSHQYDVPKAAEDFSRSRAAEGLSRKAIRALISKGAGSGSYPGPCKLFLLVRAPSSLNLPVHFLPKRDFRHNKKTVPLRLMLKCKNRVTETKAPSDDLIWFQCRHVIKGLACNTTLDE